MLLTKEFSRKNFLRYAEDSLIFGDKTFEIHINNNVISTLNAYRQLESHQHEKGGILIGRFTEDKVIIVGLTHPFSQDKSTRFSFNRQDPMHDKILQAHWQLSHNKVGFAGDWHTHPESIPTASSIDLKGWENQVEHPHPYVFLIQGIEKLTVYLCHINK